VAVSSADLHGSPVDHGKEFPRAPVVSQASEGHCRPDGRMRVLSAVFSNSWGVPFDIAGIQRRRVERRIQKLDQPMLAGNEALITASMAMRERS